MFSGLELTKQLEYSEIILSNPNVFNLVINFEFYYYECESVNDRGWGSGWRCFQSFLKTAANYITKLNHSNNNNTNNNKNQNQNEENIKSLLIGDFENKNLIKILTKEDKSEVIASNHSLSAAADKYFRLKTFDFSFENLFLTYGSREKLDQIYIKKRLEFLNSKLAKLNVNKKQKEAEKENEKGANCLINEMFNKQHADDLLSEKELLDKNILSDFLREKAYAPFETQYAWAEPFILYLISFDFNLKTKLYLLNGSLEEAFTPKQVFEKTLSFAEFIKKASDNFTKNRRPLPIIIDDGVVPLCILDFKKAFDEKTNEAFYRLFIADPHIAKGKDAISGFYSVDVSEAGKFLRENNKNGKMNGKRLRLDVIEFMIIVAEDYIGDNIEYN